MGKDKFLDSPCYSQSKIKKTNSQWPSVKCNRRKNFLLTFICLTILLLCLVSCTLPRFICVKDNLSKEEHLNLGVIYEKNGEFGDAIKEYKKAAKKLPRAYSYIGNIYFQKGEFCKAEKYYKKSIKDAPYYADAYNNLAWLYCIEKKNIDDAEGLVLKAIQINPSKINIYKDTLEKIREVKKTMD